MFKQLAAAFGASGNEAGERRRPRRFSAIRQAFDDWRFGRDIASVMAAFDRLSDRQLNMIGLERESLYETVEEMILDAERQRALGLEVTALLEAPAETAAMQPAIALGTEHADAERNLQAA